MRIKRYRPNFVEGFEDEYAEVSSKEELLKIPFVASWSADDPIRKFKEFCIDGNYLVAFFENSKDGSKEWYVVAKFLDKGYPEIEKWFKKADYND